MLNRLPKIIDPLQFADKRGTLKGQIPINSFTRLADVICDDTGFVDVELFFEREGRLAKIDGTINTVLQLICQNCLHAVAWPVNNTVKLGIVASIEHADRLPDGYEPLLVAEDGKVAINDIVEDELIIHLPDYPKHQQPCWNVQPVIDEQEAPVNGKALLSEKPNPFSILAKLKNSGES
jgi:uncharacterized protein